MALKEDDNLYDKADLEDYADTKNVEVDDSSRFFSPPKRETLLADVLGLERRDIERTSSGGYQGIITFVFTLDGMLWVVKDSYGSCSGCDGLLACSDEDDVTDYATKMCRNAYAFSDADDAKEFVRKKAEDEYAWGWPKVADGTLDAIERVGK